MKRLLLTLDQAAKQLGVPRGSLRTAAETHGYLVRMGRALRIDPETLSELIKLCRDQKQVPASTNSKAESSSSGIPAAHNNQRALETAEKLKRFSRDTSQSATGQSAQVRQNK